MPRSEMLDSSREAGAAAGRFRLRLASIILSAILVRVAAALIMNRLGITTPQNEHWAHARSLYDGTGFGFDWYGLFPHAVIGSFVPPLYAGILAGFLHLFHGADRAAMLLAQILNAVLSGCTAGLIALLARRVASGATPGRSGTGPLLAALAWAFYPPAVGQSAVTNTAVMEGFVLIALAALLARASECHRPSGRLAISAGLLLGAGLLLRPTFGLIWIGWSVIILARLRGRSGGAARTLVLASLIAGLAILPWTARNYRVHGTLIPIATNGGFNFAIGNDPRYAGGIPPLERIFRRLPPPEQERLRALKEVERDRAFYAEGIAHWRESPAPLIGGVGRKVLAFVLFRPYLFQGYPPWVAVVFVASYAALLALFVAGLRCATGAIRDLSLSAIVLTGLLSIAYVVSMRYRASVEPLMAIIGAAFLCRRR